MADLVSSKQFSETAALSDRLLQSSALKAVSRTGSVFDQLYKQNRFFEQMTNPSWMEQVVNPPIQRALDRLTPQATGFQSLLPDVSAFIGPLSIDLTALAGPAVMASVPGFDFSTMFTDLVPSLSVVVDFPGLRVAVDSALGAAFQPERMAKAATAFNRDLFSNFATAVPVTALRLPGIPFGFTAYNSGLITPETSAWKWSAEIDAEAVLQVVRLIFRRGGAAAAVAFLLFIGSNVGAIEPALNLQDAPVSYLLAQTALMRSASAAIRWGQDTGRR